ncbi:MAG: transposase [Planctomycetota bacterium]
MGFREAQVVEEPELEEIKGHKRKKKGGHGRQPFPDHLQRADWVCDLAEDDKTCDVCEAELRSIGEDICERGHLFPAQIVVNRYIKLKYACPKGHGVKTAEAPAPILERCKYEPSVYANIVVSKYADHLPLNRQESIFKRQGFTIPRSTMGDMIQRVVEIAGDPIIKQMKKELVEESFIQADETPITVLQEGKKGSSQGYLWVYRSKSKVLFDFRSDRKRDGPSAFLKDFAGTLQTDGYAGYNEIVVRNGLTRAGCWSHARRKFNDALKSAKAHAGPMMVLMAELFRIEAALKTRRDKREMTATEFHQLRAKVRQRRSQKIIEQIKVMLLALDERHDVLPKSEIGKAVIYAMNQWQTLIAFLEHPEAELENNAAERAIRQVALGRKNWMFAGSAKGGHAAAVLYSLVGTCKVLDINPQAYLEDVLTKVSTTPTSEAHTLTPWAWAASQPKS